MMVHLRICQEDLQAVARFLAEHFHKQETCFLKVKVKSIEQKTRQLKLYNDKTSRWK